MTAPPLHDWSPTKRALWLLMWGSVVAGAFWFAMIAQGQSNVMVKTLAWNPGRGFAYQNVRQFQTNLPDEFLHPKWVNLALTNKTAEHGALQATLLQSPYWVLQSKVFTTAMLPNRSTWPIVARVVTNPGQTNASVRLTNRVSPSTLYSFTVEGAFK